MNIILVNNLLLSFICSHYLLKPISRLVPNNDIMLPRLYTIAKRVELNPNTKFRYETMFRTNPKTIINQVPITIQIMNPYILAS